MDLCQNFRVKLCKGLMNPAFIWGSLKGRCHGNQLKSQNPHFSRKNFLRRAAIPKRIGISERQWAAQKHIACGYIMYKFDDVWCSDSRETFAYFCTFVKKKFQKEHIWLIIREHARPISTNYSALIDIWVGIINLTYVLRSLKGRCYGNQLIWDTFCKPNVEFDCLQS